MKKTYFGAVENSNGSYGIIFPDFWGCTSASDTLDGILAMGHEALQGHIEVMIEQGDAIPEPSAVTLQSIRADISEAEWIAIVAIEVTVPKLSTRVAVPIEKNLIRKIDALKISRMAFINEATKRELARLKKSA